jgi:alkanesulfonate monooxygenase SsuD/methylene tetrahydromethanopterin reductase-like flavin-dependent oxidoreductase (luciferase family)
MPPLFSTNRNEAGGRHLGMRRRETAVKFSIMIVQTTPEGRPERYEEITQQVLLAEELGYERVWLVAHEFTGFSRPASMLTASYLAAVTSRIRLGIGVSVLPLQHPLRVAEEAAVLDHLSGGRLDFGVGRGIQPEAYAAYGLPMDDAAARLWEGIDILVQAWTNEEFSYDGKFWQIPPTKVRPRPVQRPHPPLWAVGVSPSSIRRVAASGLNGLIGTYMNTLDEVGEDVRLWRQERERSLSGEQRASGEPRPLLAHNEIVYVAESDERAKAEAEAGAMWYSRGAAATWEGDVASLPDSYAHWRGLSRRTASLTWDDLFERRSLMGSPERVAAKVRRLASYGIDELILFMGFGTLEHARALASMRLFAERVMPMISGPQGPADREG